MLNLYFFAAIVLVFTALAHSVLGELLMFRQLSNGRIVAHLNAPPLRERHIRILWASWHLVSVFGLAFAFILFRIGGGHALDIAWLCTTILTACFVGALLVLAGTKGRHPGWIALSVAGMLIGLAINRL